MIKLSRHGSWSTCSGIFLHWERIYKKDRPTSMCKVTKRYTSWLGYWGWWSFSHWLKTKILWAIFYKELNSINNLVQIQCSDGNWNYDSYMHGMANGMILIEHTLHMDGKDVKFLDPPSEWLAEKPILDKRVRLCEINPGC